MIRSLASSRRPRRGLSLLEVLLSVAIFLLALGGISHLMSVATRNAEEVRQRSKTARLCQSKLAEVVAGVVPMDPQTEVPVEEEPDMVWSLEAEPGTITGLWNVTVRVGRVMPGGQRVETVMSQMVLDPSLVGSTHDAATIAGSESTEGSGTGSTGSGSGTTTPGSTGSSP